MKTIVRTLLLASASLALATGCANADAEEDAEPLASSSSALTSADVCRFEMIHRGPTGGLLVNEVGPAGETCITTQNGSCAVAVDRIDFRSANVTDAQRQAALARIDTASSDPSLASTLFHGKVMDVTVRDHRTGTTRTERRYMVDGVYFAPTNRQHSKSYYFMFDEYGQRGYGIGGWCRQLPAIFDVTWASGVSGPSGVLNDVIVTGTATPSFPNPSPITADQYFVHQQAATLSTSSSWSLSSSIAP